MEKFSDFISEQKNEQPYRLMLIIYDDPNDPNKKTEKSKLYAGYLVFSFKLKNTLIYKIQIDFIDKKGADISKVLDCAIKSLNSLK